MNHNDRQRIDAFLKAQVPGLVTTAIVLGILTAAAITDRAIHALAEVAAEAPPDYPPPH